MVTCGHGFWLKARVKGRGFTAHGLYFGQRAGLGLELTVKFRVRCSGYNLGLENPLKIV